MAEMNMNVNPVTPTPVETRPVQPQQNVNRTDPALQAEQERSTAEKISIPQKKELENVVSVSEDGDTVQASKESVSRLEESSSVRMTAGDEKNRQNVRAEDDFRTDDTEETDANQQRIQADEERRKAEAERRQETQERIRAEQERREEIAEMQKELREVEQKETEQEEKDKTSLQTPEKQERVPAQPENETRTVRSDTGTGETEKNPPASYAGISEQQLEQMYMQGTISKYDYDSEIASREQRLEASRTQAAEFNQNTAEMIGVASETRQNFNAIENAYDNDENAEEARQATERLEAMAMVQQVLDGQK